jgi:maltoporin
VGSLEVARIDEEGLVLQAIKDGRGTVTDIEIGVKKVDFAALREHAAQQNSQSVSWRQILDDMIDVLSVPINWRENVTRR